MQRSHLDVVSYGAWSIDVRRNLLHVDGKVVRLQRGVLKLFLFLVSREGQLLSKDDLIAAVWEGQEVSDAAIYNRVSALRKAISDDDGPERCIQWEYGRGLRFARPQPRLHDAAPAATEARYEAKAELQAKEPAAVDAYVDRPESAAPPEEWQQFLGSYFIMFRTPSWPNAIQVGVSVLKRLGNRVVVWTNEHGEDPTFGVRQRARFRGSAEYIDGRIYVMEQNLRSPRSVCLTALDAPHAFQPDIMTGMMLGSSWRLQGAPYATRVVWRRVPPEMSLRQAIRQSGPYADGTDGIDEAIRESIGSDCLTFHEWDKML